MITGKRSTIKIIFGYVLPLGTLLFTVFFLMKHEQIILWLAEQQTGVHITHEQFAEADAKRLKRCFPGVELADHCFLRAASGVLIPVGEPKQ
jgi:hypothetical protein